MEPQGKAKVALTFSLYQGDQLVRRETIAQDIVKVGKDQRSHLRVDDEAASRMHAVIEVQSPSDITLIDLGTEPGTTVNGQRVNKCKIRPGDQIQIGTTTIHLESAETASAAAPIAPAAPLAAAVAAPVPAAPPSAPRAPQASSPGVSSGANPFQSAGNNDITQVANPFAPPPVSAAVGASAAGAGAIASAVIPPPASPFAAGPFVAPAQAQFGINAPGGNDFDPTKPYTYSMVKNGPDVNPDEVEVPHVASVEVIISWDQNVLHISHLTPPRNYFVGSESGPQLANDYEIPEATLGTTRAPIVVAHGVSASLVMLPRSTGYVEIPGQGRVSFADLISSGRARPSSVMTGAHELELPAGAKARMELESGLNFQVSAVNAGKAPPVGVFSSFETAALLFVGLSFFLHAGIVASLAFFMPHMNTDDSEAYDRDQMLMMQKLLNASAEREEEEKEVPTADNNATNTEGGTGTRAKGEEGAMGSTVSKDTGHKYGVQGPQDNPDPHIARQAAIREAAEFGMIGLLNTGAGGDPNAPTAPWGRDESSGQDAISAHGNMWGDTIGDSFGAGGLGLSGFGEGGGGTGEGIGLGNIGTLGHGSGLGNGNGFGNGNGGLGGIGRGSGHIGGAHVARSPTLRQGATEVNGRLPPEVIQRIVRQNFGRFRLCYENGMRNNPSLQGRVSVKFVIDRTGGVSTTQDGGSDLPDQSVISCVVRGFGNLSFPQPEGGIVQVTYPIIFNPGE